MPMSAVAPRVAGWQRRLGGQPGPWPGAPASASGEASNGLMVELLVDGSWVDITDRVMVRDNSGQISITRGQSAEGSNPNPGTCSLQLNNRDGLFSPANPVSPYYGKIGRNTQLRVSVPKGDDKSYRFWGEIPAWPEDWDSTGADVWVDIQAAGILQRLNQGTTPLRSTMYRGLMSAATTTPEAYWPCEDGSSATSLASALGGRPMTIGGSPSLGADTGFACSAALPTMGGAAFTGVVPTYTVTGQSQVRFLMYLPTAPADDTVLVQAAATGTVPRWVVAYATGGALALKGLDTDGTVLFASGAITFAIDGERIRVSAELTQDGANVGWALSVINASTGGVSGGSGTFAAATVGRLSAITVAPAGTLTDAVFGHISVQSDVTSTSDLAGQVTAFLGETVTTRLNRLSAEEGVNYITVGALSTDTMGPQLPATFLTLVQECVDVDQGVLFEREVAFGLAYRPRVFMYTQNPRLSLSYPGNQLAQIPKPVPDAKIVQNDVTASRPAGSSARVVREDGPLSVLPPPLGVGTYPDAPTLNVPGDDDLLQHAAWRVHLGTVDEPRYPAISINLAHPSMATARTSALNVLPGHRIVVTDPPGRLGGDISQIVIGITETLTHFEHRITYVCQPESPYHVGVVDASRAGGDASHLAGDMTPTGTTVDVATTIGAAPWVTGAILNTNPTFGVDTADWSASGAAIARVPAPAGAAYPGGWALRTTPDGVAALAQAVSGMTAVTDGTSYRVRAQLLCAVGRSVDLNVNWFNAAFGFLSTSTVNHTVSADTWTDYDGTFTAPAGAAYAQIVPTLAGTPPTSHLLYVSLPRLTATADTGADQFPIDIRAGGEVMIVTAITGAGSPQTFTVTRSVNGVVKTHQAMAPISLFDITYAGL